MADQATEHMSVSASPERLLFVADIERYPGGLPTSRRSSSTSATIQGRPALVTFRAAGLRAEYELTTPCGPTSPRPHASMSRGCSPRATSPRSWTGATCSNRARAPGRSFTYHLEAELLRVPIPGFIGIARPEPHHVDGHAGAEAAGRVFRHDARRRLVGGGRRGVRRRHRWHQGARHRTGCAPAPWWPRRTWPTPTGPRPRNGGAGVADAVVHGRGTARRRHGIWGRRDPPAVHLPSASGPPAWSTAQARLRFAPNLPRGARRRTRAH